MIDLKKIASSVLLFSLLTAPFALTACNDGPDYSKYRVRENIIGTEKYDDKEFTAYLFKPEDADARLEIVDTKKSKVAQSYDFSDTSSYYSFFEIEYALIGAVFQDMNFDGYLDLYIPCCASTANLEGMAWLWDKESSSFVLSEELCEIYELIVDTRHNTIMGTDYTAEEGPLRTIYEWKDGKLVKTSESTVKY